jgi:hypothetical protein
MAQLTTLTQQLNDRIRNRQSHRVALNELIVTSRHCMSSGGPTGASHKSQYSLAASGQRRDPAELIPNLSSLENVLRRSGLSLPDLLRSPSVAADELLQGKREAMLRRLEEGYRGSPAPLRPYLDGVDKASQLLASSLNRNSGDNAEEPTVSTLEARLDTIRCLVEELDVEGLRNDPEQAKFLQRWE